MLLILYAKQKLFIRGQSNFALIIRRHIQTEGENRMLLAQILRMQLLVNHGHSFGDCRSSYLAGLAAFVMKMEQLPHISESPKGRHSAHLQ